ncbi:uncharacterized protein LOC108098715 [Drosophila ficusphila]|uniref:uncharacterized protein LOC108098715 n=1 Tax=Drosophila ficusphila TaxID=30025 RepID=UPI0007E7D0E9|nr:uncharacterized protein LOC108098715 [Drosophila ficusphila]
MTDDFNSMSAGNVVFFTVVVFTMCVLFAVPQWMMLCLFADNHLWYTLACILIGFLLLTCIHLVEFLKYKRPYNYIAIFICYEFLTLGTGSFLMEWDLISTIIVIVLALLYQIAVLFFCFLLIYCKYTGNPFKLAVVGGMGFVLAYIINMVDILKLFYYWYDLAVIVFLVSVTIMMIAHVLITHMNFESLVKDDILLVAIVMYITYLLLVIGARVSAYCLIENIAFHRDHNSGGAEEANKSIMIKTT